MITIAQTDKLKHFAQDMLPEGWRISIMRDDYSGDMDIKIDTRLSSKKLEKLYHIDLPIQELLLDNRLAMGRFSSLKQENTILKHRIEQLERKLNALQEGFQSRP